MIELIWEPSFKRSYKRRISYNSYLKKKFWAALETFSENPFEDNLETHKLTGKLEGLWAFAVDHDWRVIFRFLNDNKSALLIDVGSHEEVY